MVPDQVIFLLVQDNIELACSAIEKAAMDRAVIDVDEGFAAAYELRRRHREVREASAVSVVRPTDFLSKQRPGQAFWDNASLQSPIVTSLPDPLRIKASGVQPSQMRVYEEFKDYSASCLLARRLSAYRVLLAEPKRGFTSRPNSTASYSRNDQIASLYSPSPMPEQPSQNLLRPQEAMERFNVGSLLFASVYAFKLVM